MRRFSIWLTLLVSLLGVVALFVGCFDTPDMPIGEEGCVAGACHQKVEMIHYGGVPLSCVDCHGGDPTATTKETAHPTTKISFNPSTPGTQEEGGELLRGAALAELDAVDPDVLQFLNPADYRVVNRTCGSTTRGGGNCHTRIAEHSILSNHATLAGQLAGGLYFGGITDRSAHYGVMNATDPFPTSADGYAASLSLLPDDVDQVAATDPVAGGYFGSMGQLCVDCHLARDGRASPGLYTSSGCNACHLLTDNDSRPLTTDETQSHDEQGHGRTHRLTNLIPDAQCNHCHHAHLHRGLLAQGVREKSEPDGDMAMGGPNRGVEDPPNAVFWSADHYVRSAGGYNLYDKPFPFYIEDEDGTNNVDETPPDIHTEKGMGCIDCHTQAEVHGPDHMAVRREFETQIHCQSCHGTPGQALDPGDIPIQVALSRVGGTADDRPAVSRNSDGALVQYGKLDQKEHPLTEIANRVDPSAVKFNPRTQMGCGLHSGSAAFRAALLARFNAADPQQVDQLFPGMPKGSTLPSDLGDRDGRVECFACHNTWTVNCYGCHVERDDRVMARNQVTGAMQPGKISNYAMSVVADSLALGFNTRGRISPMVGTSIFFTHIGANGEKLVDAQPLRTVDGFSGDANEHNPVHHHTVRRQPRDCPGCHPRADGLPDDEDALKRVIGFGTGKYTFIDGSGRRHLLDALVGIDFNDDGVIDDPETTPLGTPFFVEPLAASTHLSVTGGPGPGPLDLDTIRRLLENHVVPQRPN